MIWVIIPVYQYEHISPLCHDLLEESEYCNILIVDNGDNWNADWERRNSGLDVIMPKDNLGWLRGCNFGLEWACRRSIAHDGYLLLNDDTRLSPGFVKGLLEASDETKLVGPMYDDVWPQQKCEYDGKASQYKPKPIDHKVQFIDGTAMYIPQHVFRKVGYLDYIRFGQRGWGGDFDYCIRARSKKVEIVATERSYLNHFHQATAKKISSNWNGLAGEEMNSGMKSKYGENWRSQLGI